MAVSGLDLLPTVIVGSVGGSWLGDPRDELGTIAYLRAIGVSCGIA